MLMDHEASYPYQANQGIDPSFQFFFLQVRYLLTRKRCVPFSYLMCLQPTTSLSGMGASFLAYKWQLESLQYGHSKRDFPLFGANCNSDDLNIVRASVLCWLSEYLRFPFVALWSFGSLYESCSTGPESFSRRRLLVL